MSIARTVLWAVYPHRNSRVAVLLPVRLRLPSSSTATPYYFPNHYSHNTWTEIGGRSARIEDNCLIIVGENGSGKTTFLRMVYHFVSGKWFSLLQFSFESIEAVIDGVHYRVTLNMIKSAFQRIDRRLLSQFPNSVRHRMMDWFSNGNRSELPPDLERMITRMGWSIDTLLQQLEFEEGNPKGARRELLEISERIRLGLNAQVLYLPTYRRIERELGSIFEGADVDEFKTRRNKAVSTSADDSYVELVEFGMKDVQLAIEGALSRLKDFARENLNSLTLRYLGDVVNKEYLNVGLSEIANLEGETITSVLDRIPEGILTTEHKTNLLNLINIARSATEPNEHSKIICHYFLKLYHFQQSLKDRERNIAEFCKLCSAYIRDKQFEYDSANFGFSISYLANAQRERQISLSDLSSGEKQVVSLFSHLYLSGMKRYIVLIDEPELSLSVPWQRRFLIDIREGGLCAGLIAVTHSPFIYDNNLRKYAHSLGEFTGA